MCAHSFSPDQAPAQPRPERSWLDPVPRLRDYPWHVTPPGPPGEMAAPSRPRWTRLLDGVRAIRPRRPVGGHT